MTCDQFLAAANEIYFDVILLVITLIVTWRTLMWARRHEANNEAKAPQKAIIAFDKVGGSLAFVYGTPALERELREAGLSGVEVFGCEDTKTGIWVWEGVMAFQPLGDGDYELDLPGEWRLPNAEEWALIVRGLNPFNPADIEFEGSVPPAS